MTDHFVEQEQRRRRSHEKRSDDLDAGPLAEHSTETGKHGGSEIGRGDLEADGL
jgi:hypothetical protein